MYRETYARIDLDCVRKNVANTLKVTGNAMLMAVVKADAYGHGCVAVSKAAVEAGASWLAIALAEEGIPIREAGITAPVLILGISNTAQKKLAVELDLSICVSSKEDIAEAQEIAAAQNKKAKLHIKIDSGMGRIGFRDECALKEALACAKECKNITIEGIFTHFAKADYTDKSFTAAQFEKFRRCVETTRSCGFAPIVHCANSAAICDCPETYFDMVRLGISLYGYYASGEVRRDTVKYHPVMSVHTAIAYLKTIKKGETVGYGATFTASGDTKIATLPIGYGDGYNRLLSNKGSVIVVSNGKAHLCPIVGRICMDQTMADVTGCDGVKAGDEVVILGEAGGICIDADEIAEKCGTISYEVLLDFNYRVPRVYKGI